MRVVATLAIAVLALPAHADPRWEAYARFGALSYDSSERYFDGFGGGPGVRLHLGEHVAVQADVQWLVRLGQVFAASAGVQYQLRSRCWRPAAALRVSGYAGDQLRFVRSGDTMLPGPLAGSVGVELAPLRFDVAGVHASAIALGYGLGFDGGTAVTISILEVGVPW